MDQTKRLRHSEKSNQAGFAALIVLLLAGTMAGLSMMTIQYGRISLRVNTEKQLLDSHAMIVGHQLVHSEDGAACNNGRFTGDTRAISRALYREVETAVRREREYNCTELASREEEGVIIRRFRVTSSYDASYEDDNPTSQEDRVDRSVIVEIKEMHHINDGEPELMFLLDFSGSMAGKKEERLKDAMRTFIGEGYGVEYGLAFFSREVLETVDINVGPDHDDHVDERIDAHTSGGGTNYRDSLVEGINALERSNNPYTYLIMVSDGYPTVGGDPLPYVEDRVFGVDPENCKTRTGEKCHTIYTLGVDGADKRTLKALSGNAANPGNANLFYDIKNDEIEEAFEGIIRDILCTFGPLNPAPTEEEEDDIGVFQLGRRLENSGDNGYLYDFETNEVKLYGRACDRAIDNADSLTIRFGKPKIIFE